MEQEDIEDESLDPESYFQFSRSPEYLTPIEGALIIGVLNTIAEQLPDAQGGKRRTTQKVNKKRNKRSKTQKK